MLAYANPAKREAKPHPKCRQLLPVLTLHNPHPAAPQPPKNPASGVKNTKLGLEIAGLLVLIVYTVFSALQWLQIRYTNNLTARALDGNDKTLSQTLNKLQGQTDATNRLGDYAQQQVGKLDASIQQASRLATDTETANANVLSADRPWMGAAVVINKFAVNEKVSITFEFTNSGHRPARVEISKVRFNAYTGFPQDPEKEYIIDAVPSTTILVPGQPMFAPNTSDGLLAPQIMSFLESRQLTYYAFGEVVYRDIRTNEEHWTHICIYYIPKAKTDSDPGFRNCPTYNDAN
jgi:hypothetical protein